VALAGHGVTNRERDSGVRRDSGFDAIGEHGTVGVLLGGTGIGPIEIIVLREHAERAYELLHPGEQQPLGFPRRELGRTANRGNPTT